MRMLVVTSVVLSLAGCARLFPLVPGEGRFRGTVTYRQRIALPPEAVVYVALRDVTRADMPVVTLAAQRIETAGRQVPIPFELPYDQSVVSWGRDYAVEAAIAVGGLVRWRTPEPVSVITHGDVAATDVVVAPVDPTPLTGGELR